MRDEKTGEWLEPTEGEDLSSSEGRMFKKDPMINIISKEEFEIRIEKVFHLLWKALSKSFGPYGAPTLICTYPYRHMTKDGYTIMKNLSFDASETKVDQAIADMAGDICGRLNYSVGDGTTSAIIATNSIYQNYRSNKDYFKGKFILPRDIMKKYDIIKDMVIDKLSSKVTQIKTDDPDELYKNIYDVVYVSSNGNELITEYISDLYRELGAPGISCIKAPDGITKKKLINGYKFELSLADRLYINSDDKTMNLADSDVIIFGTKVTETTYRKILKPLNEECRMRGRHLIVCAPFFDETALSQVIAPELNNEYRKNHDVNMVLSRYRAVSAHTRRLVNDFAILMNTDVIDRVKEKDIIDKLASGSLINQVVNIDNREIEGIQCIAVGNSKLATYVYGSDSLPEGYVPLSEYSQVDEDALHLGFVRNCSLGLNTSQFTDMVYDENRYQAALKEAKDILEETEKKYQQLGTFNVEVNQCQERLYSLKLKMGIIEVGADSELSQAMIKDAVDDAVKAAESAYKHGVVLGCNTNLIQSILEVLDELDINDTVNCILVKILLDGFKDVYKTVLGNAFEDVDLGVYYRNDPFDKFYNELKSYIDNSIGHFDEIFNKEILKSVYEELTNDTDRINDALVNLFQNHMNDSISLFDVIINYSIKANEVFDISSFRFSNTVKNSVQTDQEILRATIDLISLLIVGNQMVVTQKHNFED